MCISYDLYSAYFIYALKLGASFLVFVFLLFLKSNSCSVFYSVSLIFGRMFELWKRWELELKMKEFNIFE